MRADLFVSFWCPQSLCSNIPAYPELVTCSLTPFASGSPTRGLSVVCLGPVLRTQIFLVSSLRLFLRSLLLIPYDSSLSLLQGVWDPRLFLFPVKACRARLSLLTWRLSLNLRCMVFPSSFRSMYFWISPETPSLPRVSYASLTLLTAHCPSVL